MIFYSVISYQVYMRYHEDNAVVPIISYLAYMIYHEDIDLMLLIIHKILA